MFAALNNFIIGTKTLQLFLFRPILYPHQEVKLAKYCIYFPFSSDA